MAEDDQPDMQQSDHPEHSMPATTAQAVAGLAQARENNRPANKYQGNNQIQTRATMSTYTRLTKDR